MKGSLKYWFLLLLLAVPAVATTTIKVVAIDSEKQGKLLEMDVDVVPGRGRILLSSLPFTGIDTQLSERQAVDYALRATGQQLGQRDVIFTFKANVNLVEGQSAGAAMALGTIGELEGKTPRQDVVVTGAIDADGRLIGVGGALEKARAAGTDGINVFLLPQNSTRIIQPMPRQKSLGGEQARFAEPVLIDLTKYASEHWGMEAREIKTVDEAETIVFGTEQASSKAGIKNLTVVPRAGRSPLSAIGEDFIEWAEALNANGTKLEKAREYLSEGHEYAGANEAFLAWVDAKTESDLNRLAAGNYSIEDEQKALQVELDAIEIPDGYSPETINWQVGAQQRYIWAQERLSTIPYAQLDNHDTAYNLNLVRGWLHIVKGFLAQSKEGNLTFNLGLVPAVNKLSAEADTEIVAALALGEDTYGAFPLRSSAGLETAKGWYLPAGYDAINAKVRASSYDGESEQWRTAGALSGLEKRVAAAKETGLGFWPEMYLDGARIAVSDGDYQKAYLYATMARDFADFELKAMSMQSLVGVKPITIEKIVKEKTEVKVPQPCGRASVSEKLLRLLNLFFARYTN